MGWHSDWLYGLIFAKFRDAWLKAQNEGRGHRDPASADMLISQYGDTQRSECAVRCRGEVLRRWMYCGDDFEELPEFKSSPDVNAAHGMFYEHAYGAFNISPDRKIIVLEYGFGPLYGRGFVYDVKGQGARGRNKGTLTEKPDAPMWIS